MSSNSVLKVYRVFSISDFRKQRWLIGFVRDSMPMTKEKLCNNNKIH